LSKEIAIGDCASGFEEFFERPEFTNLLQALEEAFFSWEQAIFDGEVPASIGPMFGGEELGFRLFVVFRN
jgi:hypothetical protein